MVAKPLTNRQSWILAILPEMKHFRSNRNPDAALGRDCCVGNVTVIKRKSAAETQFDSGAK